MAQEWNVAIGATRTRAQLVEAYGGSVYSGGIVIASDSGTIFVHSDPQEGEKYGYNYDGWSPSGLIFNYTGAGSQRDQTMTDRNRALLEHREGGRALRVFVADGTVPGTQTKLQKYIGEFAVDETNPFTERPSSSKGVAHSVTVFHLRPVDGPGGVYGLEGETRSVIDRDVTPVLVSKEVNSAFFYETSGNAPTKAEKLEATLVEQFSEWLGGPEGRLMRWALPVPGDKVHLLTDVFDTETRCLYEAKASARRGWVRLAIGQLLDYERHVPVAGLSLALLLPSRPSEDLLLLCLRQRIGVTYRDGAGGFEQTMGDADFGTPKQNHRRPLGPAPVGLRPGNYLR